MIVSHEEAKQLVSQSHMVVHVQNGHCIFPKQDHPYKHTPFDMSIDSVCEVKTYPTGQVLFVKKQGTLIATFIIFDH